MSPQPLPADTVCSCCGQAFHCGVADDTPCWCAGMRVDAAALKALAERYHGCLCPACIKKEAGAVRDWPA